MTAGRRVFGLSAALIVWVADRLSKEGVLAFFSAPDAPGNIRLAPFLDIILVWNPGISFGMLDHDSDVGRWLLVGATVAISAVLVVWLLRAETRLSALALGLVIGGALGNIYDRVWYGAVADFLDAHWAGYHWWTFNVADAAISVGVALLIWDSLFGGGRRDTRRERGGEGDKNVA